MGGQRATRSGNGFRGAVPLRAPIELSSSRPKRIPVVNVDGRVAWAEPPGTANLAPPPRGDDVFRWVEDALRDSDAVNAPWLTVQPLPESCTATRNHVAEGNRAAPEAAAIRVKRRRPVGALLGGRREEVGALKSATG
jgi:hypothetical protein